MNSEAAHEGPSPFHRLLKRAYSREVVPYLVAGSVLLIAILVAGEELGRYVDALESWIEASKPWSVVVFVGLFALITSLLLPEPVLSIVAGATFGLVWGGDAVVTATLLAAALQYVLSRQLLRARIQVALDTRPSLAAIQRAVLRDELRLQVLLRLTPLNPATLSYVLGAAGVRFRGFMLACLATLPAVLVEVYFGHASKHVARVAGSDARTAHLHDLVVLGGLALSIFVMTLVSRAARRALLESEASLDLATSTRVA